MQIGSTGFNAEEEFRPSRRRKLISAKDAAGPVVDRRTRRLGVVPDVSAGRPQSAPLPEGFSLGEPRGTGREAKSAVQGSGRLAPEDTQRIAESFLTPEGRQETQTQKRMRDTTTREGALAALDKVRLGRVTRGEEGNDPVRQRFLDRVDARIADQGQIDPEWLKEELRLLTSAQSSKEVDEAMALPFGPTGFEQTQEQKDWEESGVVRKIVEPMGKAVGDTMVNAYRTGLKGIAQLTGQNPAAFEGDLEGTEGAKMARGAASAAPYFVPGLGHAAAIEGGYRAGLTLAGGHGAWKAVNEIVPVEMVVKGLKPGATTEERTAAIVAALAMGYGARKPVGKAVRSGAEALGRLSDRLRTFAEPKAMEFADSLDALAKADPDGVEAAWADPELQATFRKPTPETQAVLKEEPQAPGEPSSSVIPNTLFHGTKSEFDGFDLSKHGTSDPGVVGEGVYFTPNEAQARNFAESPHYGEKGGTPRVIAAKVGLKNPAVIVEGVLPDGRTLTDVHPGGLTKESAAKINRELKANGHDGVVFQDADGTVTQVVAFDPKSATPEPQAPGATGKEPKITAVRINKPDGAAKTAGEMSAAELDAVSDRLRQQADMNDRPSGPVESRLVDGAYLRDEAAQVDAYREQKFGARTAQEPTVAPEPQAPIIDKVLYHGTRASYAGVPDPAMSGDRQYGRGAYFSESRPLDNMGYAHGGRIVEARVRLDNPFFLDQFAETQNLSPRTIIRRVYPDIGQIDDITDFLKSKGHDGVIVRRKSIQTGMPANSEYVVFDKKSLSSATPDLAPTVAPEPPQTGASGTIPADVRTEGQPGGARGGLREDPGVQGAEPPAGARPPVVETAPEPTTTGIAHADTGAWRKEAGLDPYVKTRYKVNGYSQKAIDDGHADNALAIADQVNAGSKTSADRFEQEGLRLGFHKVKSEVRDLEAAKSDAVESGDAMALAEAESRLADAVGRGDRITKALDKVGSEAGGTLGARAYDLIDEGDALDLRRKAQSQSGTKVTEAQQKVLDEAAAKVKEAMAEADKWRKAAESRSPDDLIRSQPRQGRVRINPTNRAGKVSKTDFDAARATLMTVVEPGGLGAGLGGIKVNWTDVHQQALKTAVRYIVQNTPGLRSLEQPYEGLKSKVREMFGDHIEDAWIHKAVTDELGRPRAVTRAEATARAKENAARRQSRRAVDQIVEEAKEAQRTFVQKAAREVAGVLATPRRMMTFLDDSAVGRQGLFLAMTHPGAAGKAFVRQWEVVKKDGFDTTMGRLMDDPVYDEYKGMGGYLSDPRNGVREEGFVSSVIDKIPGLSHAMRGSEELMAAYLNVLRLESYKALRSGLEVGGHEATVPELRWAATTVNVASGRGIGPGEGGKAQRAANQFFFSPQLLVARLRMATGDSMVRGAAVSPRAFALGSAEYAKYLAARAVLATLMAGLGGKTATDVKDKEFGQTRFGKLKVDTSGGMDAASGMVWGNVADLAENAVNAAQGRPLRRAKYADAPMDRALRFFGNRTAPIVSYAKGLASGTDFKGDPFEPGKEALKMLGPIHVVNQIDGSLAKEGATASDRAKMAVLEIFGFSTGFYDRASTSPTSSPKPPGHRRSNRPPTIPSLKRP